MKKTIKNLSTKTFKNLQAIKGGVDHKGTIKEGDSAKIQDGYTGGDYEPVIGG